MHLIIFDVDGTLLRSSAIDATCYARAVGDVLGVEISTNWSEYSFSTDAGILNELFDRHGIAPDVRRGSGEEIRHRFVSLLSKAFASNPACCSEVAGAGDFFALLRGVPGVRTAIATGGWSASARMKLLHANISIDGIPFASSDDAFAREDILRLSWRRASECEAREFDRITYVGDGLWDLRAATLAEFHFVGIDCEGNGDVLEAAGAPVVLRDFADSEGALESILAG